MRFASLGSGSEGNGLVLEKNNTRLLLDCGFGLKDSLHRLNRLGLEPSQLNGILITHEHDDHAGGAFKLAAKFNLPIWLSYGSLSMLQRLLPKQHSLQLNIVDSHQAFAIQDIQVQPYPVPHDAREPVQFTFSDGARKLGVLTDTGTSTPHIEAMLNACDALVLECNHDLDMLMQGPYTWPLKKRVSSRLGHLDNQSAAELLAKLDNSKLQHLVAAHLSAKNNTPHLARLALSSALNCQADWIAIAEQSMGLDWRSIA